MKEKRIPKGKEIIQANQITIPKNYNLHEIGISQSLIIDYLSCRWKFLYSINRWSHIGSEYKYAFGSLIHDMLDKIYNYCRLNKSVTSTLIGDWIDEYDFGFKITQDIELLKAKAEVLLIAYMKYYPEDFESKKFDEIESVFEVDFHGYKLRGKKDGRFLCKGKKWLMEHKTKSRIEEALLLQVLNFDFQNLFYITADEIETGEEIQGVLYNIVRNPSSKPKKNERLSQYTIRLRKEVEKDPAHYFLRYEIPYTKADKNRFTYELAEIIWEIQLLLDRTRGIYRNTTGCTSPYNCDFLNACCRNSMIGYERQPSLFMELK